MKVDVINTLALGTNTDPRHRIYYRRDGAILSMPLSELEQKVLRVAAHLQRLGIGRGDRVGVMSWNSIEWVLADLAVLKVGGLSCGFDVGRFDPQATMEKYGLSLVFVEEGATGDRVLPIATLWEWANSPALPFAPHSGYGAEDAFAIKFTSGSTGPSKAMEALVGGLNDSLSVVQEMFTHGENDNILVFLRLAQLQQRYWIYSGMVFGHDITVTNLDFLLPMAQACKPTVVMGVPGVFEDLERNLESRYGDELNDPAVRRERIQSTLGGSIRYLWTGSAPASATTLSFYHGCGVPLYQGYGLNETCIISKNCPGANRLGSVGKVLRCKSIRFDENGVLIVKSERPIIKKYLWCKPGDNERLFLPDGEIITNDLGYLDADGYLFILGRVDDLIVLATGRNVMVAAVEDRIKAHPDIQQCVLYGHGKPFLAALISPASDHVDREAIHRHIDSVNASSFPEQKVRGVVISPEQFSRTAC